MRPVEQINKQFLTGTGAHTHHHHHYHQTITMSPWLQKTEQAKTPISQFLLEWASLQTFPAVASVSNFQTAFIQVLSTIHPFGT